MCINIFLCGLFCGIYSLLFFSLLCLPSHNPATSSLVSSPGKKKVNKLDSMHYRLNSDTQPCKGAVNQCSWAGSRAEYMRVIKEHSPHGPEDWSAGRGAQPGASSTASKPLPDQSRHSLESCRVSGDNKHRVSTLLRSISGEGRADWL